MRRMSKSFVAVGLMVPFLSSAALSQGTATVTVNGTTSHGVIQTQLSTNDVWSGMLAQAPGARARLKALGAPLVRLHVGDDGWPEAMPEIVKGKWNFSALDALVKDVFQSGKTPIMNIKFAPDWMWSCAKPQRQHRGEITDKTFQTFATYMARLVSYYNKGSMTTDSGVVIKNPNWPHTQITYWELWNEPDLSNETPCVPASGVGLKPSEYVTMWNATTQAMLAVDPTLKFIGPATAGSRFGSSTQTGNEYIDRLIAGSKVKPTAISFHAYGYWDNCVTDKTIFDGDGTAGGIPDIVSGVRQIRSAYRNYPLYLTEINVNAAWGNDPYRRPWTALGAAWWGTLFAKLAPEGVDLINQFDLIDGPQFGLLDADTGNPYLPYWEFMSLNKAFPSGSKILSSSSSQPGVVSLAAQRPDGKISVLIVNRQIGGTATTPTSLDCPVADIQGTGITGGTGQVSTVYVNLQGVSPTAVQLQQIDAVTDVGHGPTTQTLPALKTQQINFGGYGFAVLTVDGTVATGTTVATH
jgi:Glycosyl hydrolases family 39